MIIPVIVSMLVSTLFSNFGPLSNHFSEGSEIALAGEGRVLGVVEKIKEFPFGGNKTADFRNNLPKSENNSTFPKRKKDSEGFNLPAESGIVIDKETEVPLWEKKSQEIRPIASISKLMTALVFLENNPGWDKIYEVRETDRREGGRIYLYSSDKVRVKDLFYLTLIGSANTATLALVHSTGMDEESFIKKMNEKAQELGLRKTNFADPAGLSRFNVSTAYEIARLAKISFFDEDIKNAVLKRDYRFKTLAGREIHVESTDKLLDVFPDNGINILGGKTGYTNLAGSCFAGEFFDHQGNEVISVVLGSGTLDDRFEHTKELVEWVFSNYTW